MLESELYDRENNDNAGGGRGTGELNPPAPSAPAAVFQPPALRSEPVPASQPSGSSRPAAAPANGEAAVESAADDDGAGPGRRRRRRPSRSRARTGEQDASDAADTSAGQDGDGT